MSKVYHLTAVQHIPIPLAQAWDFFSKPANLTAITPAGMRLNTIAQPHGEQMYAGQLMEYKVRPILGIPLYWMTEITHVVDQQFFVDEQRFGPYRFWHHQHHFEVVPGGVKMTDIVHYKLPFWFLGDMAHAVFVKKQLRDVFDYRFKKVEEIFGVMS